MPESKPFFRTSRKMKSSNSYNGWTYIIDPEYAKSPSHFIRAYLIIQSDLQKIFEYVEPSQASLATYSYRIHELFMRTCIEIEANFKAIFLSNGYKQKSNTNIITYKKINQSHHLSSYEVTLPIWNGQRKVWSPFEEWNKQDKLSWYTAYNQSKHDRYARFGDANLENLVLAVSGLLVVLSSQFYDQDFSPAAGSLGTEGNDIHEMDDAIGGLFRINYPDDWSSDELYDFDWNAIKGDPDRFQRYNYI